MAIAQGRLRTAVAAPLAFIHTAGAPPALVATARGACVFYRSGQVCRCGLQQALGHAALPLACRQFPRVSVVDPRGASITLSHYCPTAAALLDHTGPATIVVNGPAFPADGEYVGLDARTSLPPLLRPGLLMDWDAWWEWEARSVNLIAAAPSTRQALDQLAGAVERTRTWTPGEGPLRNRVAAVFTALTSTPALRSPDPPAQVRDARVREVMDAIPADLRPAAESLTGHPPRPEVRRNFLLAHAFANWTGYLGQGLRTWLRSLEAADALLDRGAGVRTADLLLRHLADPFALAGRWNQAEKR